MLALDSVSKRYPGGHYGVRDVSLSLRAGILGLLGPNGAGKTTLMQLVATITRPTAGRLAFEGHDIVSQPDRLRRRLGYLPQDFGVYDNLTAFEFLQYFAALKGVHDRRRVLAMLESVNLPAVAHRTVGGFSGGMKQRLGIAQALINDPAVPQPAFGTRPRQAGDPLHAHRVRRGVGCAADCDPERRPAADAGLAGGPAACRDGIGVGGRHAVRGVRARSRNAEDLERAGASRRRPRADRVRVDAGAGRERW